ncbi:MAG: hypothetical protein LBC19_03655 [Tannerella sp.]|nr:hypothetical protein [Tannerella sp.]
MDKLLKRSFFPGNNTGKVDAGFGMHPHREIYCEGQDVNGHNVSEEEHDIVITKEKKKNRFFANYNMFF